MTTIHHEPVDGTGAPATPQPGEAGAPPPYAPPPLAPPWPPGAPDAPPTAPPPRTPASLGRITAWTVLIAVGLLGVVDASGADISAGAYLALPLTVIGAALVVGFRYGRSRGLIAVGSVLAVLLVIVGGAEHIGTGSQDVTWRPVSLAQLDGSYAIDVGDATLDLAAVTFTSPGASVDVRVAMGTLTVILPSTVDVRVVAEVNVGDADVLGQHWSGIGRSEHTVTDPGPDGTGGGDLTLRTTVDVGNLEVRR
jgi:hypothetical protein